MQELPRHRLANTPRVTWHRLARKEREGDLRHRHQSPADRGIADTPFPRRSAYRVGRLERPGVGEAEAGPVSEQLPGVPESR